MIDRGKRDLASKLIHGYFASEITNDSLMDDYPRDGGDVAIGAIYERLWGYWSDDRTEKLAPDHAPKAETRAVIDRCIAFLKSDLEYEWPSIRRISLSYVLLRICGLKTIADKKARETLNEIRRHGNLEIWPFIRDEDYSRFSNRPL